MRHGPFYYSGCVLVGVGAAFVLRALVRLRRDAALRQFCDETWLARVRRSTRT